MQTFRHRCFVLIMNSPYMDFVDASTRKLFHAELGTQGIDFKKKIVILIPQLIQYNARNKKFYYKYLRVLTSKGIAPIERWHIPKPSKEILDEYEVKKREYTDKLNTRIYNELLDQETKETNKRELTGAQQGIVDLLDEGKTVDEIAMIKSESKQGIYAKMRAIKKKGYKIEAKVDENNRIIGYILEKPDNL